MGLYNAIFGYNDIAKDLLRLLHLRRTDFERFRDAFLANGEIVVYTRLGGGNREAYQHVFERMKKHPLFLRAVDDTFDSTYCTFYFKMPEEYRVLLEPNDIGEWNPDKRWRDALSVMENNPSEVERVAGRLDQFVKATDSTGKVRSVSDLLKSIKPGEEKQQ